MHDRAEDVSKKQAEAARELARSHYEELPVSILDDAFVSYDDHERGYWVEAHILVECNSTRHPISASEK
jgi:hypothetical protein